MTLFPNSTTLLKGGIDLVDPAVGKGNAYEVL